jgi:hypothetical protein
MKAHFPPKNEDEEGLLDDLSEKNIGRHQAMMDYGLQQVNTIIFALGTGTLVLSISFISYLKNPPIHPIFLILAWVCFLLAIFGNLFSHWMTFKFADTSISLINASRKAGYSNSWEDTILTNNTINMLGKLSMPIFVGVLFFLVGGLLFLIIFVSSNLIAQGAIRQSDLQSNPISTQQLTR